MANDLVLVSSRPDAREPSPRASMRWQSSSRPCPRSVAPSKRSRTSRSGSGFFSGPSNAGASIALVPTSSSNLSPELARVLWQATLDSRSTRLATYLVTVRPLRGQHPHRKPRRPQHRERRPSSRCSSRWRQIFSDSPTTGTEPSEHVIVRLQSSVSRPSPEPRAPI